MLCRSANKSSSGRKGADTFERDVQDATTGTNNKYMSTKGKAGSGKKGSDSKKQDNGVDEVLAMASASRYRQLLRLRCERATCISSARLWQDFTPFRMCMRAHMHSPCFAFLCAVTLPFGALSRGVLRPKRG